MFDMLKNITKAAVAVAVTPIALVADAVFVPEERPLDRTRSRLKQATDALDRALEEEKECD